MLVWHHVAKWIESNQKENNQTILSLSQARWRHIHMYILVGQNVDESQLKIVPLVNSLLFFVKNKFASRKQKWWVQDSSRQVTNISADIQMILSWQDMQGEDIHMILTLTLEDRGELKEYSQIILSIEDRQEEEIHMILSWEDRGGHSDNTVARGQTEGRRSRYTCTVPRSSFGRISFIFQILFYMKFQDVHLFFMNVSFMMLYI